MPSDKPNRYPFDRVVRAKKAKGESIATRRPKTEGKVGVGRTRERLEWQARHLKNVTNVYEKALASAAMYEQEVKKSEATAAAIRKSLKGANRGDGMVQEAAMRRMIKDSLNSAKTVRGYQKQMKTRAKKAKAEMTKLKQSIAKNTAKLNAKLASKPAVTRTAKPSENTNTGMKNSKGRTIYKSKSGATFILVDGKKRYVKK